MELWQDDELLDESLSVDNILDEYTIAIEEKPDQAEEINRLLASLSELHETGEAEEMPQLFDEREERVQEPPLFEEQAPTAEPSALSAMAEEAKGVFARLNAEDYERLLAEEEAAAARDAEVEIDPRFNIGGRHRRSSMVFDGREVDMSVDPEYKQPDQGFAVPSVYAVDTNGEYFVEEPTGLAGLFRRRKRSTGQISEEKPAEDWRLSPEQRAAAEKYAAARRRRNQRMAETVPAVESEEEADLLPVSPAAEENAEEAADAAPAPAVIEENEQTEDVSPIRAEAEEEAEAPAAVAVEEQEEARSDDELFELERLLNELSAPAVEEEAAVPEADEEAASEEESVSEEVPECKEETPPIVPVSRPVQEEEVPDTEDEDEDNARSFRDYSEDDHYAEDEDYEEGSEPEDDGSFPASFKEYLTTELTAMLLRLRGGLGKGSTVTIEDKDEDLGPEMNAKPASAYYGSFIRSLRLRFRIALGLVVIMAWLSLRLPVPGMLKDLRVSSAMLLACQLNVMLLSLDVLTGAVTNLSQRRFGADALVLLSCLVTCIDAAFAAKGLGGAPHVPLCVLSSLSLLGLLFSTLLHARGMRKALRVPGIAKRIYTITGETEVRGRDVTLLKSVRPYTGFVRRCEEAAPDETLFNKMSPFIVAVALFFALIVAVAKKHTSEFVYIFSAILAPAVPFSALLAFTLPYFVGSNRIFDSGAAIAGWSGLCDIGASKNLIVTDRDLFPDGSVELECTRIFSDESSEKVIAYAGTMLTAAGSSISSCFGELMQRSNCRMRRVEDFEYLSGGGMKGIIDGDHVLCGSTDLMRLMNVRVPHRFVNKCSVLLAINGVLYGIFNMKYTAQPQVKYALTGLMRSSRHPIFAIRDFNVTPDMIHSTFDVATDGYDFPPYVDRFDISEAAPSADSKVAAVVCREGLGPLTHMADTGRSMYLAVRINLLITVLSVVFALLTVFIKLLSAGTVGVGFLLVFMLLWALPVAVISIFMH